MFLKLHLSINTIEWMDVYCLELISELWRNRDFPGGPKSIWCTPDPKHYEIYLRIHWTKQLKVILRTRHFEW